MNTALKLRQSGATAVEFALVLIIFLTFLLGIIDFSRMLFTWNAANEATRLGARYAVVCDDTGNSAQVLLKMKAILPQIQTINLDWIPVGCTPATCEGVTLTITNLDYQWISPIAGIAKLSVIRMPSFSTFLTREIMRQDPNSGTICS
ncbi:TadE/TadG family type IV pilus assembly protein [Acidovorax sp. SRB_24]|uniref:TadE/TadG family type IV pilus assembly protein n=1 Tax=Acidovorax sp. SRB_24 TaxID=1962700 RepID=UPI00145CB8D7|nr:TadE family protein [Acidovorax sp. SRB_24]NMM78538.1 pilus assembly protein TadE [Acidovorax sp. SRB_24]